MKPLIILLVSVSLTSIGQLILKKGLLVVGPIERLGIKFFQMLINPLVILGITFAILGWGAYAMALSKSELSYAYPIWSLTYVVVPLLSLFIFKARYMPGNFPYIKSHYRDGMSHLMSLRDVLLQQPRHKNGEPGFQERLTYLVLIVSDFNYLIIDSRTSYVQYLKDNSVITLSYKKSF